MNDARWQNQTERGHPFFVNILIAVAKYFGRTPSRLLLIPITCYFLLTGTTARRASRSYLQRVLSKPPSWRDLFLHFYCFASVSIDRFFLMLGNYKKFSIKLDGQEIFDTLRNNKQGCLLFVSHIGSFDAMRIPGITKKALPIRMLMDKDHNSMAMKVLEKTRPGFNQ